MFISMMLMFISSFIFLLIIRHIGIKLDLVDKPNHRKMHTSHVPLVGGIAIYLSIMVFQIISEEDFKHINAYIVSGTLLLCVGVLDDRYDLPVIPRVVAQSTSAVIIMADGVYLSSLGALWFGQELSLGYAGYLITLLAVLVAINIFNCVFW